MIHQQNRQDELEELTKQPEIMVVNKLADLDLTELELERKRRWRLVLGKEAEKPPTISPPSQGGQHGDKQGEGQPGEGQPGEGQPGERSKRGGTGAPGQDAEGLQYKILEGDEGIDNVLGAIYNQPGRPGGRAGSLDVSNPTLVRYLGDIRKYFPTAVAALIQKDAFEALNLKQLLSNPEVVENIEPSISLVAQILSLKGVIPETTKASARIVVARLVEDIMKRLKAPLLSALRRALSDASLTRRPRLREIDWHKTIRANLRTYQPKQKTIIPERLIGHKNKSKALHDVVTVVDQSGSMAASIVYSSIFAAVMSSVKALKTSLVFFDTSVVDMTPKLLDPVDVLFGAQLGGGTDIAQALQYSATLVTRPEKTTYILISDLEEGGNVQDMFIQLKALKASGTTVIVLLALSDEGRPIYNQDHAKHISAMQIPCFACTPQLFPDLIAEAISGGDIETFCRDNGIVTEGNMEKK